MSGIVASVSRHGLVAARGVGAAVQRIRHRGPDKQRVWAAANGRVALGHARLSIIDLETGDQPIASEDDRLRIIASGELYDFERIRTDLQRQGHVFRTQSDSEVALHLYEDRGPSAVHALRGEFALAIWDGRDGQLFAARDRFGIKPLYYTVHNGIFHLASEVKAFRELGVPLAWDRDALHDVHLVPHPPSRTLFAGIYQVPPGCYLLTDGQHVRVIPYWDWDDPSAEEMNAGDEREWVERIRTRFEEAVRLRLRADVPVACYVSGGIDSCAVLGVASRLSSRPLRAYTLSFDHADYDEAAIAEEQARLSGAELCHIDVRSEELADHFSNAIYHAERPFGNAHAIARYRLSRAVRDAGIKVVLTGEGSEENDILSTLGDSMEMAHSVEGRLPLLDHHLIAEAAWMPVSMKIKPPQRGRRAGGPGKGMTEKHGLREAARSVLTDTVYDRQTRRFMSPPATVPREGRLYTFLQDTLRSSVLDGPGIYDRAKVRPMLDALPTLDAAGRGRVDTLLMWMTSLCVMHQRLGMEA